LRDASNHFLAGISLIRRKTYESPSGGKMEHFFRTIRECFLAGLEEGQMQGDRGEISDPFLAGISRGNQYQSIPRLTSREEMGPICVALK
jgi:hypothetical protein